ncbi:type III-B CRISPR-associated protein Cas10/Cmr2 [Orenia metallireducens]|uniref:Type III-B CRISPR-associated protein Cas10/Cmr2 n=2 Tax=Orenia metallireducens TaxID=1413210 RepID=A0A1C0A8F1_9FIRM|nr:type III-B CRISPR-associated protein Cas10/Cmr2 [Orenia metallireducens]
MRYILGANIKSVQDYIIKSRKTKDLSNSSKIISDMMKNLIKKLDENTEDLEMIYPRIKIKDDRDTDYSNYAILTFKAEKADKLINEIEENAYKQMSNEYKKRIVDLLRKGYIQCIKTFQQDVETFFKNHFKVNIAMKNLEDYKKDYSEIKNTINNMKNTYEFEQLQVLEGLLNNPSKDRAGLEKCSICGEYTIRYSRDKEMVDKLQYTNLVKEEGHLLKKDESLCDICFYKRVKDNENDVPSTYNIATTIYIQEMEEKDREEIEGLLEDLDGKIKDEIIDGRYYYLENLHTLKEVLEDEKIQAEEKQEVINNIDKLSEILQNKKAEGVVPPRQYALIQLDIDNLGDWMSGNYFETGGLKEKQQELSELIIDFSKRIKEYFNDDFKGHVVYAGGDDFLAFLPVEYIFKAVAEVRDIFKELKSNNNQFDKLTYSICVTLAEVKIPLSLVIKRTREALELVKKRYDDIAHSKDGIVFNNMINVNKIVRCYLKNNNFDKFSLFYYFLKDSLEDKGNSVAFMRNIEQEFNSFDFVKLTIDEIEMLQRVFKAESSRLIKRSLNNLNKEVEKEKEGEQKVKTEILNEIIDNNYLFFSKQITEISSNHHNIDYENYINILNTIDKLLKYNLHKKEEDNAISTAKSS